MSTRQFTLGSAASWPGLIDGKMLVAARLPHGSDQAERKCREQMEWIKAELAKAKDEVSVIKWTAG